ncbi:hypothetical protein M0812_26109 [Anaeramoeba flamelloides]|uniref:Uncharacterized protein n=1 Tax=Anaeramoeba flamelloides TaxID=1746091 RepID=A0AAV7YG55_9EUKA|nr:hypothetical protein M0812_26109 [Anaeramoeba flamelloides]|eukprot:Anaeramoba_flamelloidesa809690_595.p1 GENE.a809690_595~~a809690_595.p1  ORF type:complete len:2442 (-),score=596.96 a809690_595:111-7436(-)
MKLYPLVFLFLFLVVFAQSFEEDKEKMDWIKQDALEAKMNLRPPYTKPKEVNDDEDDDDYDFVYHSLENKKRSDLHKSERILQDVTVSEPAIIPFGRGQETTAYKQHAYQHVINQLRNYKSQFLIYPRPFSHTQDSVTYNYQDGSIFDLKPDMPEEDDEGDFFNYIEANTDIDLTNAKALYDTNIAVLRIVEGRDLTYEGVYYCDSLRTFLGKWDQCYTMKEYQAMGSPYLGNTKFLYFDAEDVQKYLSTSYGLFILPDIARDSEDRIIELLGETGKSRIQSYVENGGTILASGKSGYLLEKLGLIVEGTFDAEKTLQADGAIAATTGCGEDGFAASGSEEFLHRTLCFGTREADNTERQLPLLSAYVPDASKDPDLTAYVNFNGNADSTQLSYKDKEGFSTNINGGTFPAILRKPMGEGQMIVSLGSTAFKQSRYAWFYNIYFAAISRDLILDRVLPNEIIPALETYSVTIEATFTNYFTRQLNNVQLYVFSVKGTEFNTPIPSGCVVHENDTTVDSTIYNVDEYLICTTNLAAGASRTFDLSIYIFEETVTQKGDDTLILYNRFTYDDPDTGDTLTIYPGNLFVDARMAALIRASYNPDPSSIYPIKGEGNFIDDVLNAENKENTKAEDVLHVAVVPLISPVTDGNDQAIVAWEITLDWQYYNNHNWIFPFEKNLEDFDYLEYLELYNFKASLAADWDTSVKIMKELTRDDIPEDADLGDVLHAEYQTNIDSLNTRVKQSFFEDADLFFEHATQRLMVYCDTTEELPAQEFWVDVNNIPDGKWTMKDGKRVEKKKLFWVRNDVYFYDKVDGTSVYPLPSGITEPQTVFTIDRFTPKTTTEECVDGLGAIEKRFSDPGWYDSSIEPGIKYNEYYNEILMPCGRQENTINWEAIPAYNSGSGYRQTHYVFPNEDSWIESAGDLMDFDETTGEYLNYPELKYAEIYGAKFTLDPATTRKGGYFEIVLPDGFTGGANPVSKEYVTFSADQIAIYKMTWSSGTSTLRIYFKRGNMPNESHGVANQLEVNFEEYNSVAAEITLSMDVYALTYDLSSPQTDYETYKLSHTESLEISKRGCFICPAIRMEFVLSRGDNEDESYMNEYEAMEPFVRFGVYVQELQNHVTIWGSLEVHPISDPGAVALSGGMATITHVGISSIPFREFLTTGVRQLIPAGVETGRVEWKDIWGRHWVQPVRSIFLDVPPIPPPLKNFIMTTTFELLDKDGNRVLDWNSDEELDIHVQVKLLNNYPKYFEITTCPQNMYNQLSKMKQDRDRWFTEPNAEFLYTGSNSNYDTWIHQGHSAKYGECFMEDVDTTILSGKQLTDAHRQTMEDTKHCSDTEFKDQGEECQAINIDVPTISRRPKDDETDTWNYCARVDDYYPKNYVVKSIGMWDLTHIDYDDNPQDKAYKYHMDNRLPSIDNGIIRPHNIIAFPIFKGLGYKMYYESDYTNPKFEDSDNIGWWSDNLQTRDDTLVAGQQTSNAVSVDKFDYTLEDDAKGWIEITDLEEIVEGDDDFAAKALTNIYTCNFNRHRVRVDPKGAKRSYLRNVYQNNMVPVDTTLTKHDAKLTSYDCSQVEEQYTDKTIHEFNNYLETDTARDWLYFASNLRGGAKENLHVIYKLEPFEDVMYESLAAKIHDGGRFVYWNPANGPNSFLIVDNPVSTVNAKRCDFLLYQEIFPTYTTTYEAIVFDVAKIYDYEELYRKYEDNIYINHYGFGDSSISVYVGAAKGTSSALEGTAGEETYIKVEFFNNAGFDWNLYDNAIEAEDIATKPISGNDLLHGICHNLKQPTKYLFMTVDIPDELEDYIEIKPSEHALEIAATFFDFESVNVVTVRDGFKAVYFYHLTIIKDIPDELKGKLWEFEMNLHESYFDKLPSHNDPTKDGFHDYHLQIPNWFIGFKRWGSIYYSSGFSSNLDVKHYIPEDFNVQGAKWIQYTDIQQLRIYSTEENNRNSLLEFYEGLENDVPFSQTFADDQQIISYDLEEIAPKFPIVKDNTYDEAWLYILLFSKQPQMPYGRNVASYHLEIDYDDWKDKRKHNEVYYDYYIDARGAWLDGSYDGALVSHSTYQELVDQTLYYEEDGIMKVTGKFENVGSDIAYNVDFRFKVPESMEPVFEKIEHKYTWGPVIKGFIYRNLTVHTEQQLIPYDIAACDIYLKYSDQEPDLVTEDGEYRLFVEDLVSLLDMTEVENELRVTQNLETQYYKKLEVGNRPKVNIEGEPVDDGEKYEIKLSASLENVENGDAVTYIWKRRSIKPEKVDWKTISVTEADSINNVPLTESASEYSFEYAVSITYDSKEAVNQNPDDTQVIAESHTFNYDKDSIKGEYFLFLLFLLPVAGAAIFVFYKRRKENQTNGSTSSEKKKRRAPPKVPNRSTKDVEFNSKVDYFVQKEDDVYEREIEMQKFHEQKKQYAKEFTHHDVDINYVATGVVPITVVEKNDEEDEF